MTLADLIEKEGGNAAFFRLFKSRIPLKTIESWKSEKTAARRSTPWMPWVLSLAATALKEQQKSEIMSEKLKKKPCKYCEGSILPNLQAEKVKRLIADGCGVGSVLLHKVENGQGVTAIVSPHGHVEWAK